MSQFRPLGRRDIFGILLPGTIVVFVGVYALFGMLTLLRLPVKDLLEQQFLLALVLFVSAYLVGSLLRMYAADFVDKRSSERLMKEWRKKHRMIIESSCMSDSTERSAEPAGRGSDYLSKFEECREALAMGGDPPHILGECEDKIFRDWLHRADKFPYHAWLHKVWRPHGFCGVLDFFQDHYKTTMWSKGRTSRISFFNYCKLVVIGGGGALADEVVKAEGLTRFFAGTVIALRISAGLLVASLIAQLLSVIALALVPQRGSGLALRVQWTSQSLYLALTLVFVFVLVWIRRKILERFRYIRLREVETVYHAFHIHSVRHTDGTERDQVV